MEITRNPGDHAVGMRFVLAPGTVVNPVIRVPRLRADFAVVLVGLILWWNAQEQRFAMRVAQLLGPESKSRCRESSSDFVKVAQDEGRRFMLLAARLQELGSFYGALSAHDRVWDSAASTSKSLLAHLAVEHCVHEARGLDVLPTTISRFRNGGDDKTADLLETIVYPEEITHCAAGVRWFRYLSLRSFEQGEHKDGESGIEEDEDVITKFHEIVRTYFRGPLKPPFNRKAREAARFGSQWYEPLAVKGD